MYEELVQVWTDPVRRRNARDAANNFRESRARINSERIRDALGEISLGVERAMNALESTEKYIVPNIDYADESLMQVLPEPVALKMDVREPEHVSPEIDIDILRRAAAMMVADPVETSREREFFDQAADVADRAVINLYRTTTLKGIDINTVMEHEDNVFCMAFEQFVVDSGYDVRNNTWRSYLGDAVADRIGLRSRMTNVVARKPEAPARNGI